MKTDEMKTIGSLITRVLKDPANENLKKEVIGTVSEICENFPIYDAINNELTELNK
jgi:glycine/serine hydroxymethyltransferase